MTIFLIASTILFFLLFLIWKKSNPLDFIFKVTMLVMALSGGFLIFQSLGYIVKV